MKRLSILLLGTILGITTAIIPVQSAKAAVQTPITRSQAEKRALQMINLKWTYNSSQNSKISSNYSGYVTQPAQFTNLTTANVIGIPYDWGGEDGIDSNSFSAPWISFSDAMNKGAYAGNVNTGSDHGYIQGTAGIDCSGFVQAVFDIEASKLSTSTMFETYFTKINLSDIKHMDILDRPGDHVLIFDRWGTLNGVSGAFTYESTWDQTYGGIQGTKQYFVTMDDIKNGYIPGRYINVVDDSSTALNTGVFAEVSNVNTAANFRSGNSTSSSIIGTIPKGAVLYLISSSSGWFQVKYNGQVGWIWGNTLSVVPAGNYVTVGSNIYALNIRTNPASTAAISGTIEASQYAKVIGYSSDGGWMLINNNGIQGWAYRKYLSYIN